MYYATTSASYNILLDANDIELNHGPAAKCHERSKTVRINQKQIVCEKCFITSHATCLNKQNLVNHAMMHSLTCNSCLHLLLPFRRYDVQEIIEPKLGDLRWLLTRCVECPSFSCQSCPSEYTVHHLILSGVLSHAQPIPIRYRGPFGDLVER